MSWSGPDGSLQLAASIAAASSLLANAGACVPLRFLCTHTTPPTIASPFYPSFSIVRPFLELLWLCPRNICAPLCLRALSNPAASVYTCLPAFPGSRLTPLAPPAAPTLVHKCCYTLCFALLAAIPFCHHHDTRKHHHARYHFLPHPFVSAPAAILCQADQHQAAAPGANSAPGMRRSLPGAVMQPALQNSSSNSILPSPRTTARGTRRAAFEPALSAGPQVSLQVCYSARRLLMKNVCWQTRGGRNQSSENCSEVLTASGRSRNGTECLHLETKGRRHQHEGTRQGEGLNQWRGAACKGPADEAGLVYRLGKKTWVGEATGTTGPGAKSSLVFFCFGGPKG